VPSSRDTAARFTGISGKTIVEVFLVPTHPTALALHLRNIVLQRTNRGIWNLAVEVLPERVVLRGDTTTFYSKQLAQESIRKMLPTVMVQNAIEVAA
jgi:hypothetical protein